MEIILASSSRRRQELLENIGIRPRIIVPDLQETRRPGEEARPFVRRITREKVGSVYRPAFRNALIIGSDTVVIAGGAVIGKPENREHAARILQKLSGATHQVWTGVCLKRADRELTEIAETTVYFDRLTRYQIDFYLDRAEYLDKAGAYGIQGLASLFINRIDGCYFNVMGFPLNLFLNMVKKMDIPLGDIFPPVGKEKCSHDG
jgi:septum formation protein